MLILVAYVCAQVSGGLLVGLLALLVARPEGLTAWSAQGVTHVTQFVAAPAALVAMLFGGAVVLALSHHLARRCGWRVFARDVAWSWGAGGHLWLGLGCGALLGLTYLWVVVFLAPADHNSPKNPLTEMAMTAGFPRMAWIFLVLMVAPPLEEFLFRGVLFAGFARSWGVPAASGVVTLLFVLVHLPAVWHYQPAIIAITVVGIAAMILRIRARSLLPAVALHFAYNLMIVTAVLGFSS